MTDTKGTPIKWEDVSVRVDKWKRLQALCEEVEPHEHYDGMNECNICDEPLTDVLIRHCETLLTARRALATAQAELAAAIENINIRNKREHDLIAQIDRVRAELAECRRAALTDEQIFGIAARETNTLDATRVHEQRGNGWHATTIFDGDAALLRFARAVLAARRKS